MVPSPCWRCPYRYSSRTRRAKRRRGEELGSGTNDCQPPQLFLRCFPSHLPLLSPFLPPHLLPLRRPLGLATVLLQPPAVAKGLRARALNLRTFQPGWCLAPRKRAVINGSSVVSIVVGETQQHAMQFKLRPLFIYLYNVIATRNRSRYSDRRTHAPKDILTEASLREKRQGGRFGKLYTSIGVRCALVQFH